MKSCDNTPLGEVQCGTKVGSPDATGKYTIITGEKNGTSTAIAPGFERKDVSLTLQNDATVTQSFALVPAAPGNLVGNVTDYKTGKAIANATVTACCLTGKIQTINGFSEPETTPVSTTTDSIGNYQLINLPSGLTTIYTSANDYGEAYSPKIIVAGQQKSLSFELTKNEPKIHKENKDHKEGGKEGWGEKLPEMASRHLGPVWVEHVLASQSDQLAQIAESVGKLKQEFRDLRTFIRSEERPQVGEKALGQSAQETRSLRLEN